MYQQIIILLLLTSIILFSSEYTTQEATQHIGEKATVCGVVVSSNYAQSSKGEPTFLNLDEAYPEHIFTVVIWGENREQFKKPEVRYKNKKICVRGEISIYRDVTQIILYSKSRLNP